MILQIPIPNTEPIHVDTINQYVFFVMFLLIIIYLLIRDWFKSKEKKTISNRFSNIDMFIASQSALNEKILIALETIIKTEKVVMEGITRETPLDQVKILSHERFDNDITRIIHKSAIILEYNHISDILQTKLKISKMITDCYNNTIAAMDIFLYNDKPLSSYMDKTWIDMIIPIVESYIFEHKDKNNLRRNLENIFETIKFEFYQNLHKNT